MITATGVYRVTVNEANNPTYLKGGIYMVYVNGSGEANFRHATAPLNWSRQPGTYERLVMLAVFEKQGRVICNAIPQSELDAEAYSRYGKDFADITEPEQITTCKGLEAVSVVTVK